MRRLGGEAVSNGGRRKCRINLTKETGRRYAPLDAAFRDGASQAPGTRTTPAKAPGNTTGAQRQRQTNSRSYGAPQGASPSSKDGRLVHRTSAAKQG
jgi:hypothetical protein